MGKDEKVIEDAPFEIPEFDEKEFIRKELISFRSTVVIFFTSIIAAAISYVVWKQMELPFLAHVAIAFAIALPLRFVLPALKINITHWKRKEWMGTFTFFFIFWLGFFLLFTNPPVTDRAPPTLEVAVSPDFQAAGRPIEFGAYIADNVAVREDTVRFCILSLASGASPYDSYSNLTDSQKNQCQATWFREANTAFWRYNTTLPNGTHQWFALAEDSGGRVAERTGVIRVGNPFVTLDPPGQGGNYEFVDSTDALIVCVHESLDVRAVQYSINGGNFLNLEREKDRPNCWRTNPTFPGWVPGSQDVTIRAEEQPTYLPKGHKVPGQIVTDPAGTWRIKVGAEFPNVGSAGEPQHGARSYVPAGQTPGVGVPIALAGIALLVVARRRSPNA